MKDTKKVVNEREKLKTQLISKTINLQLEYTEKGLTLDDLNQVNKTMYTVSNTVIKQREALKKWTKK